MYCLLKMCHLCLKETDDLITSDAQLVQAFTCFGLNAFCPNTSRIISICEKCALKIQEVFEFVSVCQKNSKIVQNYINLLSNGKEINDGEAQLVLRLPDTVCVIPEIKLEYHEVDETVLCEEIRNAENRTTNSIHSDINITIERNRIKSEIKIEHATLEYPQGSLTNAEILIDQCHSELNIKEDLLNDTNDSEEVCYANKSAETPESPNDFKHISNKILTNIAKQSVDLRNTYNCTVCSKCFRWKSHLNRHMLVHCGERQYNCTNSKKGCTCESTYLNGHMCIRKKEKPFQCSTCNKCFYKNIDLIRHIRIHTGEKPFECSTCKKRFNQRSYLNCHIRIHSEARPYECSICNRSFKWKSNLKKHTKLHAKNEQ